MAEASFTTDDDRMRRIEALVRRLELVEDAETRELAEQLMQAVLDLHGSGLEKIMELAFESGATGETLIRRYASDGLVSSLLVLHGLHPDDLETRVRQVLSKIGSHAELASVLDGVVRVRLSPAGCGSADADDESLRVMIREAVPDVADILIQHIPAMNSFVPLLSINGVGSRIS